MNVLSNPEKKAAKDPKQRGEMDTLKMMAVSTSEDSWTSKWGKKEKKKYKKSKAKPWPEGHSQALSAANNTVAQTYFHLALMLSSFGRFSWMWLCYRLYLLEGGMGSVCKIGCLS